MQNALEVLKRAGFSARTLAQATVGGVALAIVAVMATNLASGSALAVAVGGFVVFLILISVGKTLLWLLSGGKQADAGNAAAKPLDGGDDRDGNGV